MEDSELHTQRLLGPLRESIVDKPPYTSGTLRLPTSCFSLFYKANKDGNDTRLDDRDRSWTDISGYMKSIG